MRSRQLRSCHQQPAASLTGSSPAAVPWPTMGPWPKQLWDLLKSHQSVLEVLVNGQQSTVNGQPLTKTLEWSTVNLRPL